ncbi:MAG: hypothetical protein HQ513_07395, partial [Rhodospirillales bacterium]|nr:hypothetical protein [Rhodospirillales bacterium]
ARGADARGAAPRDARGADARGADARGAAPVAAGKGNSQRTITMAVVALLVLGGGTFLGMKFYPAATPETTVDENWPFSSKCEQSPFASWWGTSTHSSMVDYVKNRHDGKWAPYIDKWSNQLNKLQDIYSRNGRVSTSDGTSLSGEGLKIHIEKLIKRISVLHCLANEAQYVK